MSSQGRLTGGGVFSKIWPVPVAIKNIVGPPPPPEEETKILQFLHKNPDKAYTFSEILMGVHTLDKPSDGGEFLLALAGMFMISLAEASTKAFRTALNALVEKGQVVTQIYSEQPYFWAASSTPDASSAS